MKKLITFILICFLISCQRVNTKIIKADLTFKSISFSSTYGGTNEQVNGLNNYLDSIQKSKNPKKSDAELLKYFSKLKKYNLSKLPYIFLLIDQDSVITVHLTEKKFKKVKDYQHVDLYKRKKKAEIELELQQFDNSIYFSDNILKVSEVDGRSHSNK